MMIVRLIAAASLANVAWQLLDRNSWSQFWGKSFKTLRKPSATGAAVAAGELLVGTLLVLSGRRRRRLRERAVEFPASAGHHPITAT